MTTTDVHGHESGDSLAEGDAAGDPVAGPPGADDLRAELAHARDRLAFYEGFDRVIAENVRRSGELMLEMLAMRDAMTASSDQEITLERQRIGIGLTAMETALGTIRTQVDTIAGQVDDIRHALGAVKDQARDTGAASGAPDPPLAAEIPPDRPEPAWEGPRVVDVIVHHVPRATVALSLQRHLGSLAHVAGVEAREFAEGILRMQVTARQPLASADLAGWSDGGAFTVQTMQSHLVELTLDAHS